MAPDQSVPNRQFTRRNRIGPRKLAYVYRDLTPQHAFCVNPPHPQFPATLSFQCEKSFAGLTGNFPKSDKIEVEIPSGPLRRVFSIFERSPDGPFLRKIS